MPNVKIRVTYSCRDCRQDFTEEFEGDQEFIQNCPRCGSKRIVHMSSDPIPDPVPKP